MKIRVKAEPPFRPLYNLPPDINLVICIGGRGGMKTYEVSKFVAFSATVRKKRCAILRDEKELIRESILNEVLLRYDTANANGHLSERFERLDTGIKEKETGEMVVFTKGFRASASAKVANLKSISNVDIAVIEEAEDIRSEEKFNTFADSIRKTGSLIILVLNTPDLNHFIVKRYFNTIHVHENFYDIVPKDIPGFMCIKTGYEDNPYLPAHIKERYAAYGDPDSPFYNPYYYYTAIRGLSSTGRKGQILTHVKPVKLSEYMALPYREVFGQDFGTSSPAGFIGVKIHRNKVWARQINYKPLNTLQIGKMYAELKLGPTDKIVADSADEKAIRKLKNGWRGEELDAETFHKYPALARGFHVVPAKKGPDSIAFGISVLCEKEIYVTEDSTDMWHEVQNWCYATDKNGNYTDQPIDDFNHLIDPLRYVVVDASQPTATGVSAGRRG